MADFVKLSTDYGEKFINTDYIISVERTRTSYDMQSRILLNVMKTDAFGKPKLVEYLCEDTAERVVEKIMGD